MAETKIDPKIVADPKPAKAKAAPAHAADLDLPATIREIAEKSVTQAKDTYDKIKSAAEETTDLIEDTYVTASKGLLGLQHQGAGSDAGVNVNASFDFARAVLQVKTLSQVVEVTSSHLRKQFETAIDQSRELTEAGPEDLRRSRRPDQGQRREDRQAGGVISAPTGPSQLVAGTTRSLDPDERTPAGTAGVFSCGAADIV